MIDEQENLTLAIKTLNRSGFEIVQRDDEYFIQSGVIDATVIHNHNIGLALYTNDIGFKINQVDDNSYPANYWVCFPLSEKEALKAIGIHWDGEYQGTNSQIKEDVAEGLSNAGLNVKIIHDIQRYQIPFGSREHLDSLIYKVSASGKYSLTDFEKYVRDFSAQLENPRKLDELARRFSFPPMLKPRADFVAQRYNVPEESMDKYYNRCLEIIDTLVNDKVHSPAEAMYIRQMQRIVQRAFDLGYFKSTADIAPDDSKWAKAIREQQEKDKDKEGGGSKTP